MSLRNTPVARKRLQMTAPKRQNEVPDLTIRWCMSPHYQVVHASSQDQNTGLKKVRNLSEQGKSHNFLCCLPHHLETTCEGSAANLGAALTAPLSFPLVLPKMQCLIEFPGRCLDSKCTWKILYLFKEQLLLGAKR